MKLVPLGSLVQIKTGKLDANASSPNGVYPFFTCSVNPLRIDYYSYDCECVLIAGNGDLNVKYYNGKFDAYQRTYIIESLDKKVLNLKYLYFFMEKYIETLRTQSIGGVIKYIKLGNLTHAKIPLIDIEKQVKIVKILERSELLINQRQSQIAALDELTQSVFLEMFGDPIANPKKFELVNLGNLGDWKSGGTPSRRNKEYYTGNITWLSSGELNDIFTSKSIEHITEEAINNSSVKLIEENSLLLGMYDSAALKSTINTIKCTCNQAIAFAKIEEKKASTMYLYFYIQFAKDHLKRQQRGVRQKNLNLSMIKDLSVVLPPIDKQYEFEKKAMILYEKKLSLIEALKQLENLYNSILQRAFKGELFQ